MAKIWWHGCRVITTWQSCLSVLIQEENGTKKLQFPIGWKKSIAYVCLLHILEENMLLPNLPLLETGWNSLVLLKIASVLIML